MPPNKRLNNKPDDTNWAEHSAVADLDTGRKFKAVQDVPMKTVVDEAGSGITYIGTTKPGVATSDSYWRIQKINESTNPTTILFANGNDEFDSAWTNRTTESYS